MIRKTFDDELESRAMRNSGKLFSIGYQERSLEDLIGLLVAAGVQIVVDVRETPWSHRREFAKTALSSELSEVGISYVHAKFAGNPKSIRSQAKTHAECLREYSAYLAQNPTITAQFDDEIGSMLKEGKNVCLICYERHPDDCHRTIVLKYWRKKMRTDTEIEHLGPDGAKRLA